MKAVVGEGSGITNASLSIDSSSRIGLADITVLGRSRVSLMNPKIVKTLYNLSDQATIELSGSALKAVKN